MSLDEKLKQAIEIGKTDLNLDITNEIRDVLERVEFHMNEDGSLSFHFMNFNYSAEISVDIMKDGSFHAFGNKFTEEEVNQSFHFDENGDCEAELI